MKNMTVSFTKWFNYTVQAETEEKAIEIAEEMFEEECYSPIADATYDEVDVWEEDDKLPF